MGLEVACAPISSGIEVAPAAFGATLLSRASLLKRNMDRIASLGIRALIARVRDTGLRPGGKEFLVNLQDAAVFIDAYDNGC